jgi:hypothetical protein
VPSAVCENGHTIFWHMKSDAINLIALSIFHISSVHSEICWSIAFKYHSRSARRATDCCFAPSLISFCHPLFPKQCAWIRHYHALHTQNIGFIMHARTRISTSQSKNDPLKTNPEPKSAVEIQWPVRKTRISKNAKEYKTPTELPVGSKVDLELIASRSNVLTQNGIPDALNGGGGSVSEGSADKDQDPRIENRPTKRKRSVTALLDVYPPVNPSIESIEVKPAVRRKSRKSSSAEPDTPSTDKSKNALSSETTEGNGMEDSRAKPTRARAKSIEPGSLRPPAGHRPTSAKCPARA